MIYFVCLEKNLRLKILKSGFENSQPNNIRLFQLKKKKIVREKVSLGKTLQNPRLVLMKPKKDLNNMSCRCDLTETL